MGRSLDSPLRDLLKEWLRMDSESVDLAGQRSRGHDYGGQRVGVSLVAEYFGQAWM